MESHRLKPMIENYDTKIFNELYEKTQNLRRKLNSEISSERFGLTPEDTLSWFDDKFIFVFNKYYNSFNKEILLGHIINALRLFKCRILRGAYTEKFSQKIQNIEDTAQIADLFFEEAPASNSLDLYKDKLYTYLKGILSPNAYYLMEIQLNPPPYILNKLNDGPESRKLKNVSEELILEYFDLPVNRKTLTYISGLRLEIKQSITLAKKHFS